MFGLFGSKKGGKKQSADKKAKGVQSIEEVRAQAMANVRAARAHIGEETLDRIAAAMEQKQRSAIEQAKKQIQAQGSDDVARELRYMLDEDRRQ